MKRKIMTAIDLSAIAYEEPVDIEAFTHTEFENFKWIENKETDVQCFIVENEYGTWVTFRGTEITNIEDWLRDLDCRWKSTPYGFMHKGFNEGMESVAFDILSHVEGKEHVYISGHSQGGSFAEQLMVKLSLLVPYTRSSTCIAIEPARNMLWNTARNFGREWGHQCYQVIHNNDIVPRVPPRVLGFNHIHNRQLCYLDENGNVHNSISWWNQFKDRVHGRIADIGEWGSDGIKDHDIKTIQKIWRNLL